MSNVVNPNAGVGTQELKVTIVPVQQNEVSVLRASGYGVSDSVTFDQYAIIEIDPDGSAIPICEDIQFQQNADKIEYQIFEDGDNLVYSGYAYRYPDSEDNLEIDLNDVFSDYLHNHISFTEGFQEMDGFLKEFTVTSSVNNKTETYNVYNA